MPRLNLASANVGDTRISIECDTAYLFGGYPRFVLVYKGRDYNPPTSAWSDCRPMGKGYKAPDAVRDAAWPLMETAKETLESLKGKIPGGSQQQQQQQKPEPEPMQQQQQGGGDGAIMAAIASVIGGIAADSVVEAALPKLVEMYGAPKQRIEVKIGEQKREIADTTHAVFPDVLASVAAGVHVMLTGPAGSGKNHLCEQVAEALDLDFYAVNAVTDTFALTGFVNAAGEYVETDFYRAYTGGGMFMFDEIDASSAEALVTFNMALANGSFAFPNGRQKRHEDFRCVAAANTFGTGADLEYVGRTQLDAATLDRFALVHVDYCPEVEQSIANGNRELLDFVRAFRASCERAGIRYVVSYRSIDRITRLEAAGLDKAKAVRLGLVKSLDADDVNIIKNGLNLSGNAYAATL